MTLWPERRRIAATTGPEPVETPQRDPLRENTVPPAATATSEQPEDTAPALPIPVPLVLSQRRAQAWSLGLALAFGLSAAVHAAAIVWLGENIAPPGIEAPVDAISVAIVLEAPSVEPVAGAPLAPSRENSAIPAVKPRNAPTIEEARAPLPVEPVTPPVERARPQETVPPEPAETGSASLAEADPETDPAPAREQSEREADETPDTVAAVVLPRENAPVPTPRPDPLPAAEQSGALPEAGRAKPSAPTAPRAASSSTAGRKGGATAGEKAAYARRLVSHVERYKRYPRAAARRNIAGAAGVSITIDRQGRLAGARLSKSSGHAVLDEEALAVARRAAPYPAPPEGAGGQTLTFSVTLRFQP